jgi:cytochrome c biogenesis protein CcdA
LEELSYFKLGWQHIISKEALDHQLFILALAAIYTIKEWREVLILVTAFTICHSLTLALSTLKIVTIDTGLVEFLIPCTIVLTAITNIFYKNYNPKTIRLNYILALFFGLVHGLGFANTIRFMLAEGQSIGWPLLQFNLGLEAGQIAVVLIILLIAYVFVYIIRLNRRWWIWFISAGVIIIALKMVIDRWPA